MKTNNLSRRAAAFMLSCTTVAAALLPAMGVAAETAPPEGKCWKTVTDVSMDIFDAGTGSVWGFGASKTIGDSTYTVKSDNAAAYQCSDWVINPESGIVAYNDTKIAKLTRGWFEYQHSCGGAWKVGVFAGSSSGLAFSDIYADADVAEGDTIRVTARVKADAMFDIDNNANVEDAESASFKAYILSPWKSNDNPGYNTTGGVPELTFQGELPLGQWNDIEIVYTVNSANKAARQLSVNNAVTGGVYPMYLYLSNVKVEKLVDEAEVDPDIFTRVNMDGFGYTTNPSVWGFAATKTVNEHTYTIGMDGGSHPYCINPNSGVKENATGVTEGLPSFAGTNMAVLDRRKFTVGNFIGSDWYNEAVASSGSALTLNDIYNDSEVSVGDRIRVSAWIFANEIYESVNAVPAPTTYNKVEDQTQNVNFRVFMYDKWKSNDDPGYNGDASIADISCTTQLAAGQWHKVTLEYTVTEANKVAKTLRIDNKTNGNIYPLYLALAGVQVENITDEGSYSVNGEAVEGTLTIRSIIPAEGSVVIVAAYNGNTFLNASVQDFTTETVPFSIPEAAGADRVQAFVWDMDTLSPYIPAIVLQKIN